MMEPLKAIATASNLTETGQVHRTPRAEVRASTDAGVDFASILGKAVTDLGQQLRQAEAISVDAIKGNASLQDVVQQVTAAEQALQASIAIRDKVVSAYLEISRMPI